MDKLNILKTLEIEQGIQTTIKYIKQWSEKELEVLFQNKKISDKTPLIIELGDRGYLIGDYILLKMPADRWQLRYKYSNLQRFFDNKKSGFMFAIYYQTGKMKLADSIYLSDLEVSRLTDKVNFFKSRSLQARKKKDFDKFEIYQTRLIEYSMRLQNAKVLLEKNLFLAKYN